LGGRRMNVPTMLALRNGPSVATVGLGDECAQVPAMEVELRPRLPWRGGTQICEDR
jgi:hypothetical protein